MIRKVSTMMVVADITLSTVLLY